MKGLGLGICAGLTGAALLGTAVFAADAPPPPRASLFISPFGQPFRAKPGEPYPVVRWFAQADANHDGRIDRSEFRADAQAFFESLDKNHDGLIDGFELQDYERDVVPEILGAYRPMEGPDRLPRGGGRDKRGAGPVDVTGGATAYELIPAPEPVASADANLTGKVTLADFLIAADRRFKLLETKGRGYLLLADLPKTPAQQAAEGGPKKKR
jgi:hypothetical protein